MKLCNWPSDPNAHLFSIESPLTASAWERMHEKLNASCEPDANVCPDPSNDRKHQHSQYLFLAHKN